MVGSTNSRLQLDKELTLIIKSIFLEDRGNYGYRNIKKKLDRTGHQVSRCRIIRFLKIIKQHHITQSMSRKGNCRDNAVAESFFHTLKCELTYQSKFKTREEAKNAIFEYIEVFYNRIRIRSANNYFSPVEFESMQKIA